MLFCSSFFLLQCCFAVMLHNYFSPDSPSVWEWVDNTWAWIFWVNFSFKQRSDLRTIHPPASSYFTVSFVRSWLCDICKGTTNRLTDQCLNGTPNDCDYHQQSHTGGHTCDDTMDARQCLICITSSDWMSGRAVGKKEAMVPFCR